MKNKMIEFLLNNANPSIKQRIKSEILNSLRNEEAAEYQSLVRQEPIIKKIIACQKENGWLGNGFHGANFQYMETSVKYLGEKAVDRDSVVVKNALDALANVPLDALCYDTHGKFIDEFKHTGHGHNLIRCALIARTGYNDVVDISPQIQLSLDSFRRVLEVDSVLDVSHAIRKGKGRVFNEYEKWPCRYHLDILAHTDVWKSEENIMMLANAIKKLMKTDRPELINLIPSSWVGYEVGSLGGFPAQGFSIKTSILLPFPIKTETAKPDVYNLEYLEWLSRCGVVPHIEALQEAIKDIMETVGADGICRLPVVEAMFKSWGPYAGLQLEIDWKSEIRRVCDITFRALLILHYSNGNCNNED